MYLHIIHTQTTLLCFILYVELEHYWFQWRWHSQPDVHIMEASPSTFVHDEGRVASRETWYYLISTKGLLTKRKMLIEILWAHTTHGIVGSHTMKELIFFFFYLARFTKTHSRRNGNEFTYQRGPKKWLDISLSLPLLHQTENNLLFARMLAHLVRSGIGGGDVEWYQAVEILSVECFEIWTTNSNKLFTHLLLLLKTGSKLTWNFSRKIF